MVYLVPFSHAWTNLAQKGNKQTKGTKYTVWEVYLVFWEAQNVKPCDCTNMFMVFSVTYYLELHNAIPS